MTYLQHVDQYDGSTFANENCAPTSAANGARVATDGKTNLNGAQVRALLPKEQEVNPATPGWVIADVDRAMAKIGVNFNIGTGGWAGVINAHNQKFPIVISGVNRVFTTGCSGQFNGTHTSVIYPESHSDGLRWMYGDPICEKARWESIALIKKYAEGYSMAIAFGYFPLPVKTYTKAEYDSAVAAAKITGKIEGVEAEKRRLITFLGLDD